METIKINLIPKELRIAQSEQVRYRRMQFLGIMIILLLIFLSSLTVALRILQSQDIDRLSKNIAQVESEVNSLGSREQTVLTLKDRIININKIMQAPSRQKKMYNLVKGLIPQGVTITELAVDRTGVVTVSALSQDASLIDRIIEDLVTSVKNNNLVDSVEVDSISQGSDKLLRFGLKVIPKKS